MREEPRRAWIRPPGVVARAGRLARNVIAARLAAARRISTGQLTTGLATPAPPTTRPLATPALPTTKPLAAAPAGTRPLATPSPATTRPLATAHAATRPLTTPSPATTRPLVTAHAATRPLTTPAPATTKLAAASLIITGLVIAGGLLAAGCGAAAPTAFRPAGSGTGAGKGTGAGAAGRAGNLAGPAHRAAGPLAWPPFGGNVRVVMPGWLPADSGEVQAVIAAKNFLLAFLYAEYRGNQDDRWTGYASGQVLSALKANLSEPSVTTESFTGTIIFSHMRAFPDPATAGAIDVSECFDNAGSRNTDLATGKNITGRIPASQHYYMNTDVMAKANGRWRVISVYPVVHYPQAQECKP